MLLHFTVPSHNKFAVACMAHVPKLILACLREFKSHKFAVACMAHVPILILARLRKFKSHKQWHMLYITAIMHH